MIIKTQDQLNAACEALSLCPYITIDTEFLRDKTYFPTLCLLQMAGPDVEPVALDPLIEGLDWTPIKNLMANKDVLKVFHAARQDLEIFWNLYGSLPTPLFDTQVAAMVCGFGDQISYAGLVKDLTGHELEKSSQFTDWSRRPLSPKQIKYALDDVHYLRDVYEKLSSRLKVQGREEWVFEEMQILNAPETYKTNPQEVWKRVKIRSDKSDVLMILKMLCAWREEQAISRNVPRGRILKDEVIADIAMHKPRSDDDLQQIRSLQSDVARGKMGKQILDIVHAALSSPKSDWPKSTRKESFPKNAAATLEMLKMLLRINAGEADVAAKLIADSDDLEILAIEENPKIPAMHGWRHDVFGKDAMDLKHGKIALSIQKGQIKKTILN
jgi:ribonuclease D